MANICFNWIDINGPQDAIDKFKVKFSEHFDFNKIIPMPEVLRDTHSGITKIDGAKVRVWKNELGKSHEDPAMVYVAILQEDLDKWTKLYGSNNWYDWAIENWGTKWNASENAEISYHENNIHITFETAWGPPEPIAFKLVEMFPDLTISWDYQDEFDEEATELLA